MTLGERMRFTRLKKGLTLDDIAKAIGTSKPTVQKYETGVISNIPYDKIEAIAKILGVSASFLVGWESVPSGMQAIKKPRLGSILCELPIDREENFDGFDDVPANINCDYTFVANDDSMTGARINNGDIVYVHKQPTVGNGKIAAILLDGCKILLKRVYMSKDSIILQAENPKYPPLIFSGSDFERVQIIGLAVGFTSNVFIA